MIEEINILAQIDRYLEGNLSELEKGVFEQNLLNSADMQQMLEATLLAEQVVVGYEVLKLKQQMALDLAKPKLSKTAIGIGLLAGIGLVIGIFNINYNSFNKVVIEKAVSSEKTSVNNGTSLESPKITSVEKEVKREIEPKKPASSKSVSSEPPLAKETESKVDTEPTLPSVKEETKLEMLIADKTGEVKKEVISVKKTSTKEVEVKELSVPNEFTFNPAYDLAWPIPYDENKKPKSVSIMDKTGRAVYEILVVGTQPSEWNGESNTGLSIGIGYHVYLIEYTDGSVDKGAITILR